MLTKISQPKAPPSPSSDCDLRHHLIGLTTGYMLPPCAAEFQDGQTCCVHNTRGSPQIRAALDLLRAKNFTTVEQDAQLRRVAHHSQMRAFSYDVNVNFMVYLYILQEKIGRVTHADAASARMREEGLRAELGMAKEDLFNRQQIDAYAKRNKSEAQKPIRLIAELAKKLLSARPDRRQILPQTFALAAQKKVASLLRSFSAELLLPLVNPSSSPWFQPLPKGLPIKTPIAAMST